MTAIRYAKRLLRGSIDLLFFLFKRSDYKKYNIKHNFMNLFSHTHGDDFYWKFYTDHYVEELRNVSRQFSVILNAGDYVFKADELTKVSGVQPLHPNYRLVYETILQLSPATVLEVGCGRGDHLHNLSVLSPGLALHGIDVSKRQIDLLNRTYPNVSADVEVSDISLPGAELRLSTVNLVYTQAVLMHIQEPTRYEQALQNLFRLSTDYVVLMENWTRHSFLAEIESLRSAGKIAWQRVFFYYRVSPELHRPHLMVISSRPLQYPVLSDYSILSSTTDNSGN